MKWFDNWFLKKSRWAWNVAQEKEADEGLNLVMTGSKNKAQRSILTRHESGELESRGTAFTLYNANGGHVVELRQYDEKSDRMKNALHIVPHDKDLGESLNHIITYEALKR
jgi:uncharacterized protein YhfF